MLKSYLKFAWRNLWLQKRSTIINISGLALGTLCCLYILLYVQDQYSYDKHHKNAKDIYRVTASIYHTAGRQRTAAISPPIAPALKQDFPEVTQFTRVYPSDQFGNTRSLVKYKDKTFDENSIAYVDSTFFDVLSYHFVYGKATPDLLAAPYSAVLIRATATRLFGNEDPIGKVITVDNNYGTNAFKITGVVDESLGKTNINAHIFITMRSGGFGQWLLKNTQWAKDNIVYTYIELRPGTDAGALDSLRSE